MRVIIAEDQALLRDGLSRLFTDEGHDIVAAMGSADGVVDAVRVDPPDLVVLDFRNVLTELDIEDPDISDRRVPGRPDPSRCGARGRPSWPRVLRRPGLRGARQLGAALGWGR
jgi:DNA-binding NarL/FixJ family response regulator